MGPELEIRMGIGWTVEVRAGFKVRSNVDALKGDGIEAEFGE